MFQKKDLLAFILVSLILGMLLVRQFYVSKEAEKIQKGEENQLQALEIARLMKANTDLRLEIKELATTSEKYQKALLDRKSASEEVVKNLEKYRILAGTTQITGPGVEINIDSDLTKEQAVDLINALKNIGIEGLSINGKRLVISSYFISEADGLYLNGRKLEKPYVILVLGNAPLVKEALERKGGIIEQIQSNAKDTKIKIEKKETIVLNKID